MRSVWALATAAVLLHSGYAQTSTERVATGNAPAGQAAADGFTVDRLPNGDLFRNIHDGNFELIPGTPADTTYVRILGLFIETFAVRCPEERPREPVELTRTVCDQMTVKSSLYAPDQQWCSVSHEVGRKVYAEKEVMDLQRELSMRLLSQSLDPFARERAANRTAPMVNFQQMETLVRLNACGSPGLKRFQENLLRFGKRMGPVEGSANWNQVCAEKLPAALSWAKAAACPCIYSALVPAVEMKEVTDLIGDFTRQHFLLTAVSRVGLAGKVSACLQ